MSRAVITLTTDFGLSDSYVGVMKGVILGICPGAALVDISHEIHPQTVRQAAYVLASAVPYFPRDAVHLVVVDPGVGSDRRPILVRTGRATYVAPDNGVLSLALAQDPALLAVHLTESRYRLLPTSATFHGRDIFAPAAAHLARGTDPRELGPSVPLAELDVLPLPQAATQPDGSRLGEILHIDRFGNLVASLQIETGGAAWLVQVGGEQIEGLGLTYADVAPGELVAYVGSSGYLEIAVRDGNAAARLGVAIGDPIKIVGQP